MDTKEKRPLPPWLLFAIGAVLVLQFLGLSAWQVSRGLDKRETRSAFEQSAQFMSFHHGAEVRAYQPLKVSGRFDTARQFLLDNIILESRYGYYVLTALETRAEEPLLIVNRGWVEKTGGNPPAIESLAVPESKLTLRGRVGALPRPGYRMGEAIPNRDDWPQVAVYPRAEDIEVSLGRSIQPFVLLLDPDDEFGFVRHWTPEEMGPSRHFGYALQWFAMAAVLAGLLIWHYRKRSFVDD